MTGSFARYFADFNGSRDHSSCSYSSSFVVAEGLKLGGSGMSVAWSAWPWAPENGVVEMKALFGRM